MRVNENFQRRLHAFRFIFFGCRNAVCCHFPFPSHSPLFLAKYGEKKTEFLLIVTSASKRKLSTPTSCFSFHLFGCRNTVCCHFSIPLSFFAFLGVIGWSMVLGKLPVSGRPTIWITVGQGPTALTVGAGGGCLDIFTLLYPFSPLSPSLWETARYRLKYCLKGPLNPKQPTKFHSVFGVI